MGREVYIQDKYLHEELSIWLCHYGISRAVKGAPQFSFVVREGNCGVNNSISQDLLYQKARVFFGLNYKDTEISRKLFSVVKGSYTNELFEDIHFLSWDKENPLCFHSHYATRELLFLYAYGLIDSWETLIPDKKEISMDDVLDILKFDKVFGLDGINTDEALSMILN